MGIQVKKHKNDKFTITNTNTNEVVLNKANREDVIEYLLHRKFHQFQKEAIHIMMTFPNDYSSDVGTTFLDKDLDEEWVIFTKKSFKAKNYPEAINDQFNKLMKKFKITLFEN